MDSNGQRWVSGRGVVREAAFSRSPVSDINVKIKIASGTPCGAVAAKAKINQANWVVLDKKLKHEEKRCMEELQ
ncbi:hypothetical protein ACS0TY_004060 [Phlomoides rotata]